MGQTEGRVGLIWGPLTARTAMVLVTTAIFAVAAVSTSLANAERNTKIKIGVSAPLTGVASSYATDVVNALHFANQRIAHGAFDLIVEDDRCEGRAAVSVAKKLVEVDGVQAIIGYTCSPALLPVAPYLERKEVVAIATLAGAPRISEAGKYIFRTIQSDALGAGIVFERALAHGKKLGVLTDQNEWNLGIQEALLKKQAGSALEISVREVNSENFDYRTSLSQLIAAGAQSIFLNVVSESALLSALRQLNVLRFQGELYAFYHPASNTFKANLPREPLPPLFYIDNVPPEEMLTADGKSMLKEFEAQYGPLRGVPIAFVSAMESMRAAYEAVQGGSTSGKDMKEFFEKHSFQGLFGPWSFDRNGDIVGVNVRLVEFRR